MSEQTPEFAALDRQRLRCLRALGLKPRCFFDVGASNGWWARLVGEDFPDARFEMFEPLSDHAPEYAEPMKNLLQTSSRFRLHKCALGTESRRIQMNIVTDNPFGSSALEFKHKARDSKSVEVDMSTIDECIKTLNLPVPDVIKMDTQGCELIILQGAKETLPQVDVLFCETWLVRSYGPSTPLLIELADWLRDAGFYPWDFTDVYRDDGGTLISQDCIFLNARSEISRLTKELKRRPSAIRTDKGNPAASNLSWWERLRKSFR